MRQTDKPEPISLTPDEAQALKKRILDNHLNEADRELMVGLVSFTLWLQRQLQKAQLSIHRLKQLFGIQTEKKKPLTPEAEPDVTTDNALAGVDTTAHDGSSGSTETLKKRSPQWNRDANHGRISADDYTGCDTVFIQHDTLRAGGACPACADDGTAGRLYRCEPGKLIRLTGQPLVTGTVYRNEHLRCSACNEWFPAPVPKAIADAQKYDVTARSSIVLGRYYYGIPFYRQGMIQAQFHIPVPDATQWTQALKVYDAALPVYQQLGFLTANSDTLYYDDTVQRLLISMNKPACPGKSHRIYTTAVVAQAENHPIVWFKTGHEMAGKKLGDVLKARETQDPLLTMTDAHRGNFPPAEEVDAALAAKWCVSFCLVHGRRRFFELYPFFEALCGTVLDVIGTVYAVEKACRQQGYTGDVRLRYHQTHSGPAMAALRGWLTNQQLYGQVEPHSALGEAIQYLLRHWEALTRFLQVPDAPLDNSISERAIKIIIRHRKNSLFYRTDRGVAVGDGLTTLIHTAAQNGVSPFDYLNALQRHAEAVALEPGAWLPWNYTEPLAALRVAA